MRTPSRMNQRLESVTSTIRLSMLFTLERRLKQLRLYDEAAPCDDGIASLDTFENLNPPPHYGAPLDRMNVEAIRSATDENNIGPIHLLDSLLSHQQHGHCRANGDLGGCQHLGPEAIVRIRDVD